MSYILEALKKIEQKRTQEEALKPLSFYDAPGEEARKRPLWPIVLIAALVLNAGLLIWWIGFKGNDKKEAFSNTTPGVSKVPNKPAVAKVPEDQLKVIKKDMPALRPIRPSDQPIRKKEQAPAARSEEQASPTKPVKAETAVSPAKEKTLPEKGPAPKKNNKVVGLEELPDGLKKTLPAFRISTHVYGADPEGRLVRINDRTLQEGQEVSPGIRVEEITPGGAILSYQGARFKIGLKE
jgi:general secretion pathway protein B